MEISSLSRTRDMSDDGFTLRREIKLDTVRSDISSLSLRSSPWILGAPQNGFAFAILRTSLRISGLIGGCPRPLCRDLNLQNSLKPFLCHQTTVSGLTTIKATRQLIQIRESKTQNKRSRPRIRGRCTDRFMIASCWRSGMFSRAISGVFLNYKKYS